MPQPKRLYPPVIMTQPQSAAYDEGYERIFGTRPRGPLACRKAEEQKQLDGRQEESWTISKQVQARS